MTTTAKISRLWTASALGLALLAGACDTASTTTALSDEVSLGLQELLSAAIQDEFHAEAVYGGVLTDFGQVNPFYNIIEAEGRHSAAIARLYENRGWEVPNSAWTTDNVVRFQSLGEACEVGVSAELANVAVYDELLENPTLPSDVIRVFVSNRAASLERHLPAFQRCAGN